MAVIEEARSNKSASLSSIEDHGNPLAGPSIRDSYARKDPRTHHRRHLLARAGYRREHNHIHLYQWPASASADGGRIRSGSLEVWQHNSTRGNGIGSHMQLSFPDYEFYRDHNHVFSEMGAFTGETATLVWNRGGEGETLRGSLVSANFFSILGVRPALGRGFLPEDDHAATAAPAVVLSHALWEQRFGSDPAIVGKNLTLNGRDFTVVGVAPAGFTGLLAGFSPQLWTPVALHRAVNPGLNPDERRMHWILGVGRLKPGITPSQANADLAILGQQLATDYPDANRNLLPAALPLELVPSPFRGFAGGVSAVLMAVVGLVLLIACANVANLLLAKASSRRREVAVRIALGANRRRLVQQMLTESVLIAGIAGAIGLLLSLWAAPLLLSLTPASLPLVVNVTPDLRVLALHAAGLDRDRRRLRPRARASAVKVESGRQPQGRSGARRIVTVETSQRTRGRPGDRVRRAAGRREPVPEKSSQRAIDRSWIRYSQCGRRRP